MTPLRRILGIGLAPVLKTCVLTACLALALGGCGDDDPIDDCLNCPDDPPYPESSTPQNVLEALERAYSQRDSVKYKELHDSSYTGQSMDLQDPGNDIDLVFADEAAHIAYLASSPGLTAYLELGNSSVWDRLPSDDPSHPDWAIIQISGSMYRVEINDGDNSLSAVGDAGSFLEFAFSPTQDSSSPTDTLWRIVRWRETGSGSPSFP
jgi:hypothetical protein